LKLNVRALAAIASGMAIAGTAMLGFGVGRALHSPSPSTAAASNAYSESQQCSGCPAGTRLDSVEVQPRATSTLFVLRGQWPSSVDAMHAGVCMTVNTLDVTLKPHGSRNLFEASLVRQPSQPLTTTVVGTRLQDNALLVDFTASEARQTPLRFHVALCNSGQVLERLPKSGELVWTGHGAPQVAQATPSPTVAPSPTPSATIAGIDPVALPRACSAIPSGTVPPYLTPTGSSSRVEPDPRSQVPTQQVTVALSASPAGVRGAPFAIVVVVVPAGTRASTLPGAPIDHAGSVQLYAISDGTNLHKAIRTFDGTSWHIVVDGDAGAFTFRLGPAGASFFWAGLHAGDHFGFVGSASTGCSALGLSAALAPTLTVS
jgi:hypothetical protein